MHDNYFKFFFNNLIRLCKGFVRLRHIYLSTWSQIRRKDVFADNSTFATKLEKNLVNSRVSKKKGSGGKTSLRRHLTYFRRHKDVFFTRQNNVVSTFLKRLGGQISSVKKYESFLMEQRSVRVRPTTFLNVDRTIYRAWWESRGA